MNAGCNERQHLISFSQQTILLIHVFSFASGPLGLWGILYWPHSEQPDLIYLRIPGGEHEELKVAFICYLDPLNDDVVPKSVPTQKPILLTR